MLENLEIKNEEKLSPESASELHRLSDRRLSAKLVPIFADRECHVVSVTDPHGRILGFRLLFLSSRLYLKCSSSQNQHP
jgi:hypothetical protein